MKWSINVLRKSMRRLPILNLIPKKNREYSKSTQIMFISRSNFNKWTEKLSIAPPSKNSIRKKLIWGIKSKHCKRKPVNIWVRLENWRSKLTGESSKSKNINILSHAIKKNNSKKNSTNVNKNSKCRNKWGKIYNQILRAS